MIEAIPTWQSECAKPEKRGRVIITSGAIIVAGIMISYWVGYGFYFLPAGENYSSVRWRFPVMFQSFFTVLVMWGLLYLPDSPRWLVMRGREEEARELLARLADAPYNSEEVDSELTNIKDALEAQSRGGGFKMRELLHNGPSQNLRRTLLGITAQFFQQISGINLIVSKLCGSQHSGEILTTRRHTMQLSCSRTRWVSVRICRVFWLQRTAPNTSSLLSSPYH